MRDAGGPGGEYVAPCSGHADHDLGAGHMVSDKTKLLLIKSNDNEKL